MTARTARTKRVWSAEDKEGMNDEDMLIRGIGRRNSTCHRFISAQIYRPVLFPLSPGSRFSLYTGFPDRGKFYIRQTLFTSVARSIHSRLTPGAIITLKTRIRKLDFPTQRDLRATIVRLDLSPSASITHNRNSIIGRLVRRWKTTH